MSTITIIETVDIDAPAAAAWAVVADYARDAEWRTGVLSMVPTPAGRVEVGTTTAERIVVAGRLYENDGEVVAVDPGRSFAWRTTAGADAHGARSVEPLGPGACRVRFELHVTPHGPMTLLAPVIGRMMRRDAATDLGRLATLVTASSAAPTTR